MKMFLSIIAVWLLMLLSKLTFGKLFIKENMFNFQSVPKKRNNKQ